MLEDHVMHVPILDDAIALQEIELAIMEAGKGTSLDGLHPNIASIFPNKLKLLLMKLSNKVHGIYYPNPWKNQMLFSVAKKGHTTKEPKLRGIALPSIIPKIYNNILNNRFLKWYNPNREQAGFRPKQDCLFQIFAIFLMMELANHHDKSILIGFMDYEKAFDYMNRAEIICDLPRKGAGKVFIKSVANMYDRTYYIPKVDKNTYGDSIITHHSVTQRRNTSANFFSFNISDMPTKITVQTTFLKRINLLQLADDTSMLAESSHSLREIFKQMLSYSKSKYMVANISKTFYLEMCKNPTNDPIVIDDNSTIYPAENGK